MENLDRLFQRPWYTVYKVAYSSHEQDSGLEGGEDLKSAPSMLRRHDMKVIIRDELHDQAIL